MKRPLDLSIRFKLPLWGAFLIVVSALSVGGSLMLRAYGDVQQDVLASADSLGRTLARTLAPLLLHDDVWRAYEVITAPFHGARPDNPVQAHTIFILNDRQKVVASTRPRDLPMLSELRRIGPAYEALARDIENLGGEQAAPIRPVYGDDLYYAVSIADEEARLGTVVLVYSNALVRQRFLVTVRRAALFGALAVIVLLALTWYWGHRMAVPMVFLADRIGALGRGVLEAPDPAVYPYRDEVGELFDAFGRVTEQLRAKAGLEREMVKSERLAAIGRLASGIAHEINNPLAGMLTAIDTLREYGQLDPRTQRTIALIERGLSQIQDTASALLVEAKVKSRNLEAQDLDDVRTLLAPQARKKALDLDWRAELEEALPLPASLVRQILINLMLNAIQAAKTGGRCGLIVRHDGGALRVETFNDGAAFSGEQLEHLFEPFGVGGESGQSLGLWVTYQIVRQLGGSIRHRSAEGLTRFEVDLPVGVAS